MSTSEDADGDVGLGEAVGRNLRRLRMEAGRTQKELAGWMNQAGFKWTQVTVAQLEGGQRGRRITVEELLMLGVLLGRGHLKPLIDPLPNLALRVSDELALRWGDVYRLVGENDQTVWGTGSGTPEEILEALRLKEHSAHLDKVIEQLEEQREAAVQQKRANAERLFALAELVSKKGQPEQTKENK
jgi:transcriptional regulator with XRE-family HTH domain